MTQGIFSGLKVLDFTWAAAGPIVTKNLADNGATVVKIESTTHPDSVRMGGPFKDDKPGLNRSGFFADFNSSKKSIAVNPNHPRAKEVLLPLVKWADVVANSFRPGVMAKWGLGYEDLKKIKPDIIVVSSSLYGADGIWSGHPGYGAQGQALAGLHGMTGWPDRPPSAPKGAYTDSVSPRYTMSALIAALIHRHRTGEGQYVELSQIEQTINFLTPQLLDYQMTGTIAQRSGNRDPNAIVHGVFPCRGEDNWIAIEAWDEPTFSRLLDVLASSAVNKAGREDILAARTQGVDGLEAALGLVTAVWEKIELMDRLRANGVPAGAVLRGTELIHEPTLEARGHYWTLDHPEMGTLKYNGPAYRFETTPSKLTKAAPLLGEDTEEVLCDLLSLTAQQVEELKTCGVLT